jgi:hypothetical protein
MAEKKSSVKINKKTGCKEFRSFFHFIGQVKATRKKNDATDSWDDQPIYEETKTRTGKPMRKVQFNIETAMSNELKLELMGMEQDAAYPYSSKHRKASKVAWADRLDKKKYPDDTYHLIDPDWDKAEKIGAVVTPDSWVEVKGHYDPQEFTNEEGDTFKTVKRVIDSVEVLEVVEGIAEYQIGKTSVKYICDFKSEDFKEVNYMSLQLGVKSTYQEEKDGVLGDTKVNGVFLTYGKDRSEPKDIEVNVYQSEAAEGKKSLADAFASLERLDFIEVTGVDNNRATFTYIDVEEVLDESDPFADVDDSNKKVKKERVNNGTKKGLEATEYVAGSLVRGYLTEEEITPSIKESNEKPFESSKSDSNDPFGSDDIDPFA